MVVILSPHHTETSGYCTLALKSQMLMQNERENTTIQSVVVRNAMEDEAIHWKTKLHCLGDSSIRHMNYDTLSWYRKFCV